MFLPEITERLSRLLNVDRPALLTNEVVSVEPRPLSDLERNWIQAMLSATVGWETADISQTRVVAEGANSEGVLFVLQAPAPEDPHAASLRDSVANLWIQTVDQLTVNVQLAEREGQLQELYVLILDGKQPRWWIRTMPTNWLEESREVGGFGR